MNSPRAVGRKNTYVDNIKTHVAWTLDICDHFYEMMTTPAKLTANRQNAQLSTGPRTEEGKAVSRFNARKHGILSKGTIIPGEDPEEFQAFSDALKADLSPQGATEELLAEQVIVSAWRMRWLYMVDAGMFQAFLSGEAVGGIIETLGSFGPKMARYASSIERSFYRALAALRTIQGQRRG